MLTKVKPLPGPTLTVFPSPLNLSASLFALSSEPKAPTII